MKQKNDEKENVSLQSYGQYISFRSGAQKNITLE